MPEHMLPILLCVAGLVVGALVAGIIAFKAGVSHRKKTAEAAIGSAEAEAERIVSDAKNAAESKKKEMLLEAKDEIHRLGERAQGAPQRRAASGTADPAEGRNPGPQD